MICKDSLIIFENNHTRIEISAVDSKVLRVVDKKTSKVIKGQDAFFFSLIGKDKEGVIVPYALSAEADVVNVKTELGAFDVRVAEDEDYFTFELLSALPEGTYKLIYANIRFDYDSENKENCGAVGIPLTYWVNPCFYPDAKSLETKGEVIAHLKDKGAKLGIIIAPICEHREIIKKATAVADKKVCIRTCHGGAWSRESELNFGNSIIVLDSSPEFLDENMELFRSLGVDQLDIHKGKDTFWQGSFEYAYYKDDNHFKTEVSDFLEKNGMVAGLHTYSFYIDYDCESMLSDPECQRDFGVLETFTLADDIDENCDYLYTIESTADVCDHYGFFTRNTPYVLVGEEIIEFENVPDGFKVKKRGACGTRAVSHKKGELIKHIDGYYHGVAPVVGSELFYRIARNTARTFDAGGFRTIYLDALDGVRMHCEKDEVWFYMAAFVCEVIANCKREPMVEASTHCSAVWPSRGRFGAYDTVARGYKFWNNLHSNDNKVHTDRYATATLGWYDLYPLRDEDPGNLHTKYEHTDVIHHLGSLAVMDDSCIVYADPRKENFERVPALRRNRDIYRMYDELRKQHYFSEEVLEKIRKGEFEYHIKKTGSGEFVFEAKDFQRKKLHNIGDGEQNNAPFKNPFGIQNPFIRIEALMTAKDGEKCVLMEMDENKAVEKQWVTVHFDEEKDLSAKLAKTVSVWGNGKKGSAICIKMLCASNGGDAYFEFFIDTDFEGKRDFVLVESDNGQRDDLPFDKLNWRYEDIEADDEVNPDLFKFANGVYASSIGGYAIYRTDFHHDRTTDIMVRATREALGVKISSIAAVPHDFAILKNPSVCVGASKVTFDCELKSTDFIEFDGERAKMIDRYGNEEEIGFSGELIVPEGEFDAKVEAENSNEDKLLRAQLTLGFTGKEIR